MSLPRTVTRSGLGALLLAAPASAHFVWLHVDPAEQRVVLHFGEDGCDSTPERLIARLAGLEVRGGAGELLAPSARPDCAVAPASGARKATTELVYGLYGHSKPRYLLAYHAKGCASLAEAAVRSEARAEILAERVDDGLRLTVLLDGQPCELAEVIAMTPDGAGTEVYDTDARGLVVVPAVADGPFHARAEIEVPAAGEYAGEPYELVKHYATLTVASIEADTPNAHLRRSTAVEPWALMPLEVTSFGAAASGGHLYVLGGYTDVPHDYHRDGQSDAFLRMSLFDGSWEHLPSPGAMQSVALVAHGGELYRVGGMLALNARGEREDLRSSDAFARFDPLAREWTELAPLPAPRSSHDAKVLDGHLYVAGGWRMNGADGGKPEWAAELLRADLSTPSPVWESIEAPFRRRALGLAGAAGRVIAVGGMDDSGSVSSAVDVFDPATGGWSRGPDFPATGFGLAAVGIGERIYASAGDGVVLTWTPGERSWSEVSAWVFPRFFHQLVPGPEGELLALGGIARGGRIRHVERLALEGDAPAVRLSRWRLAAPAPVASGQGSFLKDNALCAFGGTRAGEPVRDAWRLDLAALRFERMDALPRPLAAAAALAAEDAGGLALGRASFEEAALRGAAFSYDLRYDIWDPAGFELPEELAGFAACRRGGELWLFGGARPDGGLSRRVYVRAPDAPRFRALETGLPRARRDFALAVLEDRAVLAGGHDETGAALEVCDVYDIERGEWSELPGPDVHLHAPRLVTSGDVLFLCGRRADDGAAVLLRWEADEEHWAELHGALPVEPEAELALFAFGERPLVMAATPETERIELLLVDPGSAACAPRDVAGHFRH